MKKIALLGDSIRQIGYGSKVVELLGEDYDVWQPDDNCRFALCLKFAIFISTQLLALFLSIYELPYSK